MGVLPPRSPKSRLRPVYRVPNEAAPASGRVIYQLEDEGDPVLRLRPSVREVELDGATRLLYRVEAFSRMTGQRLGNAEEVAPLGSDEEFAALARAFQTAPFREVLRRLSGDLRDRFADAEAGTGPSA